MKKISNFQRAFSAAVILAFFLSGSAFAAKPEPRLRLLGTYSTGIYDEGAAEIVAHDPGTPAGYDRSYKIQERDIPYYSE